MQATTSYSKKESSQSLMKSMNLNMKSSLCYNQTALALTQQEVVMIFSSVIPAMKKVWT